MAHCIDNVQNAKNDPHQLMSFLLPMVDLPMVYLAYVKNVKR